MKNSKFGHDLENFFNTILYFSVFVKEKLLVLCTCTYLEIMTAIGVTGYLLFLNQITLAIISAAVFLPLISFHFIMDRLSKKEHVPKAFYAGRPLL